MEEKRRLRRRYMLAEVRIRPSGSSEWIEAVLMNISKGGLGVYAMERLSPRGRVSVRITYLEKRRLTEVEEIPGVVRWVQPIGSRYAAGVMFDAKVNRATYPILSRCLDYARNNR